MPSRTSRYRFVRVLLALVVAVALWLIVALNNSYHWTIQVPVRVELGPGQALVHPLPPAIDLTVRTDGWTLVSLLVARRPVALIRPGGQGRGERVIALNRGQLLQSIRAPIGGAQLVSVSPESLRLTIGPIASKRVPLHAEAEIETKPGFQVVSGLRVIPDTVVLVGSARALPEINQWKTEPVHLQEVYQPINRLVRVSDSLPGVVTPETRVVRLLADVQEIAERNFPDIPVLNRSTVRDTSLQLVLQPPRISVLIRGGASDLSSLSPAEIRAVVDIVEGADTSGLVRPRVTIPSGKEYTVAAVYPRQVRYLWRRR
jgi:hypothetical protein